jgi:cobalamin biosynthesis Mg chelatase CobN
MGGSSSAASTSTSQTYTDSYNTNAAVNTAGNSIGIQAGGALSSNGALTYGSDAFNTSTNDSNNTSLSSAIYNLLGANSSVGNGSGASASTAPAGSQSLSTGNDYTTYIILGAIALVIFFLFRHLKQ